MIDSPNRPNPGEAAALAARGYNVLPLQQYRKHPSFAWKNKSQVFYTAQMSALGATTTGWALKLDRNDPIKIIVLDIDAYNLTQEEIEAVLYPNTSADSNLCVVQSPSGGFHYYYQVPSDAKMKSFPDEYDLGSGVKGELRISDRRNRLILLPGSMATNKQGDLGMYKKLSGSLDSLPDLPGQLLARLSARPAAAVDYPGQAKVALPTEAEHLLATIAMIADDSFPRGGWNDWIAQTGEQVGRMWARPSPTDAVVERFWQGMAPKFQGGDADPNEFALAFRSGYRTGRNNAETHNTPRDKFPTATDVTSEIRSVCGGPLSLVENVTREGATESYTLLFDGSPKRPEEAKKSVTLKNLGDAATLLGNILRISNADPDSLAKSPLSQAAWLRQMKVNLMAERGIDRQGRPVAECLQHLIEDEGDQAARNNWIGITQSEGCPREPHTNRRRWGTASWWHIEGADAILYVGSQVVDKMVMRFGSDGRKAIKKLGLGKPVNFSGASRADTAYRASLNELTISAGDDYRTMIEAIFAQRRVAQEKEEGVVL